MRALIFVCIIPSVLLFCGCSKLNMTGGWQAPNKPSNPIPANGANYQNTSLKLTWMGADVNGDNTVTYDVYLDQVDPPVTKVSSSQTDTTYTASYLSVNATYYWYIVASDVKAVTKGDIWHFSTQLPTSGGMRLIRGGTFQMGSMVNWFEQPIHWVTVSSFYMDTSEVTQDDYYLLMTQAPSHFADSRRPVETVTWFDAVLYCNARSIKKRLDTIYSYTSISGTAGNGCTDLAGLSIDFTKNGYRLPTEAEWEFACRAGTATDYYWGRSYPPVTTDDTLVMDSNAVWGHNSPTTSLPVASKKPNFYGLYDMSGNVNEWCNDWMGYGYYSNSIATDPTGPDSTGLRVVRGGSWADNVAVNLRSAFRSAQTPTYRFNGVGFRCVRR